MKPLFNQDYCGCSTYGECPLLYVYTNINGNEAFTCQQYDVPLYKDTEVAPRSAFTCVEVARCDECKARYTNEALKS